MSDSDDKKDLTAIENLSDFFHEDDPETDSLFEEFDDLNSQQGTTSSENDETFPPEFNIHEQLEEELESEEPNDNDSQEVDPFSENEGEALPEFEINEAPLSSEDPSQGEGHINEGFLEEELEETEPGEFSDENFTENESISTEEDQLVAEDPNELFDSFNDEEESEQVSVAETSSLPVQKDEPVLKEVITPTLKKPTALTPIEEKEDLIKDMKSFNDNFSIGSIAFGGNPPFAIILKNIKFKEDGEEILSILKETKLINEKNQKDYEYGIEQGALLVSQISEFSAIYLAHKFRRFDLEISVGLADELHISKSYSGNPKGLISKESLDKVTSEYVDLKKYTNLKSEDIVTSTTETIEGHHIAQYLGVISSSDFVSDSLVTNDNHTLQLKYKILTQRLKEQAIQMKANGVLDINFNLSKIPEKNQYHIICTGNAVRLKRKR